MLQAWEETVHFEEDQEGIDRASVASQGTDGDLYQSNCAASSGTMPRTVLSNTGHDVHANDHSHIVAAVTAFYVSQFHEHCSPPPP